MYMHVHVVYTTLYNSLNYIPMYMYYTESYYVILCFALFLFCRNVQSQNGSFGNVAHNESNGVQSVIDTARYSNHYV